jgi:Na+-driven multidrug efflux pump
MKDLTRGSIVSHILIMAPPIVVGMITIMICQLVDLYFVAGLGDAAVAGVAAAGNAGFLVNALMQVLGVGTVALIAHAVGATRPGFRIEHVWYLSIATTTLQAGLSLWLLRREFGKRLAPLEVTPQRGGSEVAEPSRASA